MSIPTSTPVSDSEATALLTPLKDVFIRKIKPAQQTKHPAIIYPTLYDIVCTDIYVPTICFYRLDKKDSSSFSDFVRAVEESLSRVLSLYYPLAGKWIVAEDAWIRKLICDDEGAVFVEATIDDEMDNIVDFCGFRPLEFLTGETVLPGFDPRCYQATSNAIAEYPSLIVQVTSFKCGGVALTLNFNHMTVDGFGFNRFLKAWSEIAATGSTSVSPSFDKSFAPTYFDTGVISKDMKNVGDVLAGCFTLAGNYGPLETVNFSIRNEVIDNLKRKAQEDEISGNLQRPDYFTTFDCIVAQLWDCFTKLYLSRVEFPVLTPIEGRKRWSSPPMPEDYVGNLVLVTSVGSLTSEDSFASKACKVHEGVRRVNPSVAAVLLATQMEMITSGLSAAAIPAAVSDPSTRTETEEIDIVDTDFIPIITSWFRFNNYYSLDFGSGKPFFFTPNLCFTTNPLSCITLFPAVPDSEFGALLQLCMRPMFLKELVKLQQFQDFTS